MPNEGTLKFETEITSESLSPEINIPTRPYFHTLYSTEFARFYSENVLQLHIAMQNRLSLILKISTLALPLSIAYSVRDFSLVVTPSDLNQLGSVLSEIYSDVHRIHEVLHQILLFEGHQLKCRLTIHENDSNFFFYFRTEYI